MKQIVVLFLAVVLVVTGVFLAIKNGNNHSSDNSSGSATSSQAQAKQQLVLTNTLTIENYSFTPPNISIKKGDTVTWTNDDTISHTITENDDRVGPNSPRLAPGKTYAYKFVASGTYNYHCQLHHNMTGRVIVTG